ncbi:MAG: leucine-rich repeat protein, partial [Wenyingzhuangia sp.]
MSRKIQLFITAVFMVAAMNAQTFSIEDVTYNITNTVQKQVEVTSYTGTRNSVIISPTVVNTNITYTVTKIAASAFQDKGVQYVYIPSTVTAIADSAFRHTNLKAFTIPSGVRTFGNHVFTTATVPPDTYSFELTYLSTVPPYSFSNVWMFHYPVQNNLTTLIVPEGERQRYVDLSAGNFKEVKEMFTIDGIRYLKTSSSTVEVRGYEGTARNHTIPASVSFEGTSYAVTKIAYFAYVHENLSSLTIPANLTKIENQAFYKNNNLTQVQSMRTSPFVLGDVFDNKQNINLTIPAGTTGSYTSKGWTGFRSITEIFTQGNYNYTVLDRQALTVEITAYSGSETTLSLPETVAYGGRTYTVKKVAANVFKNKNLTQVILNTSLTAIGNHAFYSNPSLNQVIALMPTPFVLGQVFDNKQNI